MVEIRSSLISQPFIIDDWLKCLLVHIPKFAKLSEQFWIQ